MAVEVTHGRTWHQHTSAFIIDGIRLFGHNTITAHVKTAMLDIVDLPGFDPTRINITTVHRTVYLMGLLTREEAERVVEIARTVSGVEKVVRVFEYQD